MERTHRPAREHRITAEEAGHRSVSLLSVIAGTVTAFGTFAVVAALVGSALAAADVETEFRTDDWTSSGVAAGLASALVLLVAYLFGGYVAGRMARRHGMLHGVGVVVLGLVVAAVVGAVAALGDDPAVEENLRAIGLPTTSDQIQGVAVFGALASLLALVVGGVLGGILGERWHTRLAHRVVDPDRGPAAAARADAERDRERAARLERERAERTGADAVLVGEEGSRLRHDRDGDGVDDRSEVVDVRDPQSVGRSDDVHTGHVGRWQ